MNDDAINERYEVLCAFEDLVPPPLDYEAIVGKELWDEYKVRRIALLKTLNDNQAFCDRIYKIVMDKIQIK